jgi:hypothetical protein
VTGVTSNTEVAEKRHGGIVTHGKDTSLGNGQMVHGTTSPQSPTYPPSPMYGEKGFGQNPNVKRRRERFKFHFISQRLIMLLAKQGTENTGMRVKESVRIMIDMSKAEG